MLLERRWLSCLPKMGGEENEIEQIYANEWMDKKEEQRLPCSQICTSNVGASANQPTCSLVLLIFLQVSSFPARNQFWNRFSKMWLDLLCALDLSCAPHLVSSSLFSSAAQIDKFTDCAPISPPLHNPVHPHCMTASLQATSWKFAFSMKFVAFGLWALWVEPSRAFKVIPFPAFMFQLKSWSILAVKGVEPSWTGRAASHSLLCSIERD